MIGPLGSVSGAMVSDAGRGLPPGLAAHATNGSAVRSRAQMAVRARATRWNSRLVLTAVGLLAATVATVAIASPGLLALARSAGVVPVAHRSAFEVGRSGISIVGTYRDCSGRSAVGWDGAYYEPCMDVPYWIGHKAVLGAILSADRITYWDAAGVPHRWRVIGRRVLPSGSRYPGRLPGAVAELQTCIDTIDRSSPVEIVDYS
jgi:hypothetical protein